MSQTQALTRAAAVGSAQARAGGDVVPSAPFLIASHGLLGWYWPVSGELSVLHSGKVSEPEELSVKTALSYSFMVFYVG